MVSKQKIMDSLTVEERFFNTSLCQEDPEIYSAIQKELSRQRDEIELIASENIASRAVLEAQGSILTNKYAEGYPGNRYYGGCQYVDIIENLAIERAKKLYNCEFVNVQANSGSQMNQAVFLALLQPGDQFMGMSLNAGGHLTHGASVNLSGKWFKPIPYFVNKDDQLLDMEEIERIAKESKPKLIIAGGTSYSRFWDWKRFREIADEVGAYLMVDMSHISGLVAGGVHPSPVPHAHVVTSTTHKSLRGPRGGIILSNDADIAKKINMAIFPGLQGGPLVHVIAAKAIAFAQALKPSFRVYTQNIVDNAKTLAKALQKNGFNIVSGGTDNHLLLIDLQKKLIKGSLSEKALGRSNIICNKNSIPFDPASPFVTSGIRLGTPAGTTRGFKEAEFIKIADLISEVLESFSKNDSCVEKNDKVEKEVKGKVLELTKKFPLYSFMN